MKDCWKTLLLWRRLYRRAVFFGALHHADLDRIERLLRQSPELVDSVNRKGVCPLVWAIQHNPELVLRLLEEFHPNTNLNDKTTGETPLSLAAQSRKGSKVLVVQALLLSQNGAADPNRENQDGTTPLSRLFSNNRVLTLKDMEGLRLLLRHGANPNHPTLHGDMPLERVVSMAASKKKENLPMCRALVQLLLEHGADFDPKPQNNNNNNSTTTKPLLLRVISLGDVQMAKLFLDAGANANVTDSSSSSNDDDGTTPLLEAIRLNYASLVHLLLQHKVPGMVHHKNSKGISPLLEASAVNRSVMQPLLEQHGADPNTRDHENNTPLLKAVQARSIDGVRLLLKYGANMHIVNQEGLSPFLLSVRLGFSSAMYMFLRDGPEVFCGL